MLLIVYIAFCFVYKQYIQFEQNCQQLFFTRSFLSLSREQCEWRKRVSLEKNLFKEYTRNAAFL